MMTEWCCHVAGLSDGYTARDKRNKIAASRWPAHIVVRLCWPGLADGNAGWGLGQCLIFYIDPCNSHQSSSLPKCTLNQLLLVATKGHVQATEHIS